ncbi:unnamed protein product, partial [Polarella glacialis]
LRLAPSLDSYLAERFHKVVLLDFPRAASWIYTMVKPLIPPKTSGKIVLLSRRDPAGIEAYLKEACGDNDTIQ